jgi:hypothetical protein
MKKDKFVILRLENNFELSNSKKVKILYKEKNLIILERNEIDEK